MGCLQFTLTIKLIPKVLSPVLTFVGELFPPHSLLHPLTKTSLVLRLPCRQMSLPMEHSVTQHSIVLVVRSLHVEVSCLLPVVESTLPNAWRLPALHLHSHPMFLPTHELSEVKHSFEHPLHAWV